MEPRTRWWLASIALLAVRSLAGLWLAGGARTAVVTIAGVLALTCAVVAFFMWFRQTQSDEAQKSAFEPMQLTASRRDVGFFVVEVGLFLVVSSILRTAFADEVWLRPVMTVVIIAFWTMIAVQHLRTVRPNAGAPRPRR